MTGKLVEDLSARGIATLTMNRPDVANTYDQDMLDGLFEAFERLGREASVRAIVLRGAGKHFCGGGDQRRHDHAPPRAPGSVPPPGMIDVCAHLRAVPQPTVAAIQGACLGGALALASCCDIRIAARSAFFAIPEVRLGFAPGPDTAMPIARALGARHYRRYAMTGQRFGAEEALRIGLVHELCEAESLDESLRAQIEEILLAAPNAACNAKRMAAALDQSVPADALAGMAGTGRDTPEAREGLAAFREKRKPAWYRR
jgi:methylglutaconyl-CoA hydratase